MKRWSILLVNGFMLVVVMLLLRGRLPLAQSIQLIKPGMTLQEMTAILGQPFGEDQEYSIRVDLIPRRKTLGDINFTVEDVQLNLRPSILRKFPMFSEDHTGLPGFSVVIEAELLQDPMIDHTARAFWVDGTHCLWVTLDSQGRVLQPVLVPVAVTATTLEGKVTWLWHKAKRLVGWE
ncbi:MAG TPA: hypothetical protein PLX97_16510 [Gemmatales bacterium]|nr:hypothetical protein [Gemmatales bacterium]